MVSTSFLLATTYANSAVTEKNCVVIGDCSRRPRLPIFRSEDPLAWWVVGQLLLTLVGRLLVVLVVVVGRAIYIARSHHHQHLVGLVGLSHQFRQSHHPGVT